MIPFKMESGLPFITLTLHANDTFRILENVLVDTGSSTCIFNTLDFVDMGVVFDGTERIRTMTGVGGDEYVLEKEITSIEIDGKQSGKWTIQVGSLGYGLGIQGIIGSDLLLEMGIIIDYKEKLLIT